MRTPTISSRRRVPAPISGLALAASAALALTACGGGGAKPSDTVVTRATAPVPSATSAEPQFDPAAGLIQDPVTLPKNCNGLVTDADIQLDLGQPLPGGDFFSDYQPLPAINQTKRVKCQYGIVQDAGGGVGTSQIEVQVATYSDIRSAAARASGTVGQMAAKEAKFEQVVVDGHPATYLTETADEVLVMYDGNRTFLITVQASLVNGDAARKLTLALGAALFKHVTSLGAAAPSAAGGPVGGASGGTPGSQDSSSGTPAPSGATSATDAGSATPGTGPTS